jgi:hypothetical protein
MCTALKRHRFCNPSNQPIPTDTCAQVCGFVFIASAGGESRIHPPKASRVFWIARPQDDFGELLRGARRAEAEVLVEVPNLACGDDVLPLLVG